jgi:hypothetical protein
MSAIAASPISCGDCFRRPTMGGFELLAIVVFFLIGYWLVDYFWPKKKKDEAAPEDKP